MSVTCHKRAVDQLDLHAKVAGLHVPVAVRKPAAASVSNSIEKSIERGHEDSLEASAPTGPMASERSSGARATAGTLAEPARSLGANEPGRLPAQGGMDRKGVETMRSRALKIKNDVIPSYGGRHGLQSPRGGGRRVDGRARIADDDPTRVYSITAGKGLKP